MTDPLQVPDDLAILIEKRDQEKDRRAGERRQQETPVAKERRSGEDRRQAPRREGDGS